MEEQQTVFSQIMGGLHNFEVLRIADRYPMRRKTPRLSPYDHFCAMVFAQLTRRESLRDLSVALCARKESLFRLGIRGNPTRNNLAYANDPPTRKIKSFGETKFWLRWIQLPLFAKLTQSH